MKKKPAQPEPVQLISPWLRFYLYATAAIAGAAVMIVEILGAKMLAPYFGTSHFVWTAQIAVTLVALAAGYYAGGRLVDRSSRLGRLYAALLVAAVYLAAGVMMLETVAYACFHFKLAVGSLLTALFLFFLPLALLAMVGPFLIRILTETLQAVGASAGRLTAISTLGSFAGTVLIGYVLIPLLPNSTTMLLTSAVLALLSAGYFLAFERNRKKQAAVLLVAAASLGLALAGSRRTGMAHSHMVEVFRGNSNFGLLQVLETKDGTRRSYLNDYLTQNTYDTQEKKSISVFTYALHGLARVYTPEIRSVLCIGLGIGIVPSLFAAEGVAVDVVEINPAVIPVAVKYFNLDAGRLNIIVNDGRAFLNRTTSRYDAVVLDAFLGDSSPSHLLSREAFAAIKHILRPEGTLVINCFADFSPGRDYFGASLDKTLKSVFPSVKIHDAGNGNVFFVASSRASLVMVHPPDVASVHATCRETAQQMFQSVVGSIPEHGAVLRDDYNPLEYYDAENRERIRRYLASSFRSY